ncbi:hypothetical protein [Sphingomonas hengshuiensis]|uniref:Uncharacterized protein n=1 Tax=Sphingomonas hengshuiensis TaxID=1609977 RepID=A0A7U4LG50_9SPHN|nr:hypothetical protein [Sphingomonas hengshuiensis]AJP73145.1 hypothetical protein TS85_17120 [Sphingomonas hengshuiensis]
MSGGSNLRRAPDALTPPRVAQFLRMLEAVNSDPWEVAMRAAKPVAYLRAEPGQARKPAPVSWAEREIARSEAARAWLRQRGVAVVRVLSAAAVPTGMFTVSTHRGEFTRADVVRIAEGMGFCGEDAA